LYDPHKKGAAGARYALARPLHKLADAVRAARRWQRDRSIMLTQPSRYE
jgi:hypothetical protein